MSAPSDPTSTPPPTIDQPLTAPPVTDSTEQAGPDWTDQVTNLIVDTVEKVRSRTTGPILGVARASVYALVALIVITPVVVGLLIGLVRLLNWVLPGDVWVAYTVLGIAFTLIGVLLWSKRQPKVAL